MVDADASTGSCTTAFELARGGVDIITHVTGEEFLHHEITGELAVLPPSDHNWAIEENEAGDIAFAGEDSVWVADLFTYAVYSCATTARSMTRPKATGTMMTVSNFDVKHLAGTVQIKVQVPNKISDVAAFVFNRPQQGFKWWWGVFDIVTCVLVQTRGGQQKRSKAAWVIVQKRWQAWANTARESICLPCAKQWPRSAGRSSWTTPLRVQMVGSCMCPLRQPRTS